MLIGVPKESKDQEYRVALTPAGVRELKLHGHQVLVQTGAGVDSGFSDEDYHKEGATLSPAYADIAKKVEMIVKVKEPNPREASFLKKDQILFTYLHLASVPTLTKLLCQRKVIAIAYETVEKPDRTLPLLRPMSEVAGRMSVQIGAHCLRKDKGGMGKMLGGIPGVKPATVTILGAGTVGSHAATIAVGMGAQVIVMDYLPERLLAIEQKFGSRVITLVSNSKQIEEVLPQTDLLIGAVLIAGAKAPKLVSRALVKSMRQGSVIVDVAVDQGGCVETTKPTTHSNPTYIVDGVVHYGVTNIPGCVPHASTAGLTNVTLPYILKIAELGAEKATNKNPDLKKGINIWKGQIVHPALITEKRRHSDVG